jgi:SNF2 family DNA or RNA helicase
MKYLGKEIEIISQKTFFGKKVAEIRILSTGEILSVPLEEIKDDSVTVTQSELIFKAIAAKIKSEVSSQNMLAPIESNIIPLPHQILALEKVMSGNYLRFLLADEVGMGKTIEAGLVLKELKLRGVVKKTLILVGKTAMQQWQQEMKKHFNEKFHIYDSEYINALTKTFARLDADNEINIWTQHNQLIVSLDALRPLESRQGWSKARIEEYNKFRIQSVLEADFDLLIIDECHKVGGSTRMVGRFNMADILCNAIPNVLLLSATPHRGKSDHFRRILGLLDADAFEGEGVPAIAELQPFVVRTEKRQAIDYSGKPLFNKRNTQKVVVGYDSARHQKQQKLFYSVTEYVVNGFNMARQIKNNSYGFVMILFQKMMSSSTQAILDAMKKRADSLSGERSDIRETVINNIEEFGYEGQLEFDFEQKLDLMVRETQINYDAELDILQRLIREAQECIDTETDTKTEYLLQILPELKQKENNPDLKFLIFTEFVSTQNMLRQVLEIKGGFRCETINGSMDYDRRLLALRNFKADTQVLISTDAAGESLNMQFAHIVINYDMPWNPMVIEQRIGRVDRIGQKDEVLALNFLLNNSVERRVYEVIETKLNQIMADLGIDKTADVLDSTLERESISSLFLESLLNPERFEQTSQTWLDDIKQKLKDYKSTEGSLPTVNSDEIKVDKVDSIKHSPIPNWLENLTKSYLDSKGIQYKLLLDGLGFRFPGLKEQVYTFNIRESLNNPIPEPVSLQHEIAQTILSEAVPHQPSSNIPLIVIQNDKIVIGSFSLWHLEVKNQFERSDFYHPVFISDEGDSFPAYAQNLWTKLIQNQLVFKIQDDMSSEESTSFFEFIHNKAEGLLSSKYSEMESKIMDHTDRIEQNKIRAFSFRERQLSKIGIENIRTSRLQKLEKDKESWLHDYDSAKQIVPNLSCLLIVKIING